jgi:hypothetical protein
MKQTGSKQSNTVQNSKSIPKSTVQKSVISVKKGDKPGNKNAAVSKYKIDAITKDNFDVSSKK